MSDSNEHLTRHQARQQNIPKHCKPSVFNLILFYLFEYWTK